MSYLWVINVNYGPASKYYDLFSSNQDLSFYKELAAEHKNAFELGVGTGRVAIELARGGVSVLGVDNSEYMLSVAQEKLLDEKESVRNRVTLRLGDMRNFKPETAFPFIYIASSTFEHCLTTEDQRKCLKTVYDVLEKGGFFAFDISQPKNLKPEGSWWIDRRKREEDEVVRMIFSRLVPETEMAEVNLFFDVYRDGRSVERFYEYGQARISSKEEVKNMLEDVGFKMVEVYGDFDKTPYDLGSQRAIFVTTKS